jgi:5'-deoxynucleotidase
MSHFFAYLSRMKFIRRWGLMHSTHPENIQEHSLRVALIAHALAVIKNRLFDGRVSPERVVVAALYHDASEVLTGDLPRPIKYFNPAIENAYRAIEEGARSKLLGMLPEPLRDAYRPFFGGDGIPPAERELIRAADKLCAWIKCLEEVSAGNREFTQAEETLREGVQRSALPEVRYFVETFAPSFRLTLDELQ